MLRATWFPAALTLVVLGSLPACRAVAHIHDRAPALVACTACMNSACGAQVSSCNADAACSARITCDEDCDVDDDACHARCANLPEVGEIDPPAGVEACRAASCGDACDTQCGGAVAWFPEESAADCSKCVATHCCAQSQACAADADCWRIRECLRDRPSSDAAFSCTGARYPNSATTYTTFDTCLSTSCANECALGALWTCAGRVPPPVVTTESVIVSFTFVDAAAKSRPLSDLVLRACASGDIACASPTGPSVKTDANGVALLTVPTTVAKGRIGFDGYFEVSDPKGVYFTALVFADRPLVNDVHRQTGLVTRSSIAQLVAFAGLASDPSRGFIGAGVNDCAARPAAKVSVATDVNDPATRVFYARTGVFSGTATDTDASGFVAFLNVTPGAIAVTATSEALGRAYARAHVVIRAGAITLVTMAPGSDQ